MKKKDLQNIKTKSLPELENMAKELRAQITRAHLEISLHKNRNTNSGKSLRQTLAQVLTLKRIKELAVK